MSILIKSMNMPTSCYDCSFSVEAYEGSGVYSCVITDNCVCKGAERHDDCPLIPVPEHGRLIDADAFDDAFTDLRWENGDYKSGALLHWGDRPNWCLTGSEIESLINAAPTIIEAEGGE